MYYLKCSVRTLLTLVDACSPCRTTVPTRVEYFSSLFISPQIILLNHPRYVLLLLVSGSPGGLGYSVQCHFCDQISSSPSGNHDRSIVQHVRLPSECSGWDVVVYFICFGAFPVNLVVHHHHHHHHPHITSRESTAAECLFPIYSSLCGR